MPTPGLRFGWVAAACVVALAACSHDWGQFDPVSGAGGKGVGGGAGGAGGAATTPASSSSKAASSSSSSGAGAGGAGGTGMGGAPMAYPASCKALLATDPSAPSGVTTIDPDGPGGQPPFDVYCEMVADAGGWTLVLKADGTQTTFGYAAGLWTDATVLNPSSTALDMMEAKLASFSSVPFDAVRVGLVTGATNWLVIPVTSTSLQALISAAPTPTSLGVAAWRGLVSTPSLQAYCDLEGFNAQCTSGASSRVRIGIVANDQNSCGSCDSWIGIGGDGPCGQANVGAGNVSCFGGDGGDKNTRAFAYVMVR